MASRIQKYIFFCPIQLQLARELLMSSETEHCSICIQNVANKDSGNALEIIFTINHPVSSFTHGVSGWTVWSNWHQARYRIHSGVFSKCAFSWLERTHFVPKEVITVHVNRLLTVKMHNDVHYDVSSNFPGFPWPATQMRCLPQQKCIFSHFGKLELQDPVVS